MSESEGISPTPDPSLGSSRNSTPTPALTPGNLKIRIHKQDIHKTIELSLKTLEIAFLQLFALIFHEKLENAILGGTRVRGSTPTPGTVTNPNPGTLKIPTPTLFKNSNSEPCYS